jgi:FkbM family methyltransferase
VKIAIYGVGAFGKIFYSSLGKDIDFFIDDFSIQESYDSKPIKKLSQVPKNTKIYISVLQSSKTIEETLLNKQYTNIINFTQSIKTIPNVLENISLTNYLWLIDNHEEMFNERKLKKVEQLLSDSKSKTILQAMINLRKTLDPKYYITPHDIEYFPSDVPILNNLNEINFIDCGAYIGDTIEELAKQTSNINYTISFEPNQTNLTKLQKQLNILKQNNPNSIFIVFPAGVYSKNDILNFSNNGIDSSASFDDDSALQIPVVSLDNILLNSSPNYIKMDIEGAEKSAILGAKKTIQKYKPNLAICLYHKPEDLWELPLLIHDIEPSYDMYIRVHEDLCLSTVLYCISKDQTNV